MKGLILKDFINMKSQLKIYILLITFCLIISIVISGPEAISGMAVMFAVLVPVTAEAYDNQSNWNRFALLMPVSKKDIVLSRYIFMEMVTLIVTGLSFAGNFIWYSRTYNPWYRGLVESFFIATIIFIIVNVIFAVIMPIIFKFGVEKGRGVFLGGAMIVIALLGIFVKGSNGIGGYYINILETDINKYLVLILLLIITLIIEYISICVSVNIYKKKEF